MKKASSHRRLSASQRVFFSSEVQVMERDGSTTNHGNGNTDDTHPQLPQRVPSPPPVPLQQQVEAAAAAKEEELDTATLHRSNTSSIGLTGVVGNGSSSSVTSHHPPLHHHELEDDDEEQQQQQEQQPPPTFRPGMSARSLGSTSSAKSKRSLRPERNENANGDSPVFVFEGDDKEQPTNGNHHHNTTGSSSSVHNTTSSNSNSNHQQQNEQSFHLLGASASLSYLGAIFLGSSSNGEANDSGSGEDHHMSDLTMNGSLASTTSASVMNGSSGNMSQQRGGRGTRRRTHRFGSFLCDGPGSQQVVLVVVVGFVALVARRGTPIHSYHGSSSSFFQ